MDAERVAEEVARRDGMSQESLIALEDRYGAHNYHPLDVVLERGEGPWVWDVNGKRYLDALSAYSALNQGHRHPRLIGVLKEQLDRLTLTSRAFRNTQLPLLCKELCETTGFEMFLPMNTGAEAVETALKAARLWGYRKKGVADGKAEIITCANNFHGRTITVVGFSTEPLYRNGFGPFTAGFPSIPFGDIAALEAAITPNTVAFLVEPLQGEAGVILPPDGYIRAARDLCTRNRVLLVADEIQSGLGRTGKLFCCQHEGVQPDMVIIGKALSGGMFPVSGVLSSREVLGLFTPGMHGSTFAGSPLAAAVAREAIRILFDEKMIENSAKVGSYFLKLLKDGLKDNSRVKDLRGKGLLVGIELRHEVGGARQFCEELAVRGILCKETHDDVIRFAPPLVIDAVTIEWAASEIIAALGMPVDKLRKL